MKNFKLVLVYVWNNRRLIGTIVGSTLLLLGLNEEALLVSSLGEQ